MGLILDKPAPEGDDASEPTKKDKISRAEASAMASAACDVLEVRSELSRYALSSLFDEQKAVWVYEAMIDARREWARRSSSHIRATRSGGLRNRRNR